MQGDIDTGFAHTTVVTATRFETQACTLDSRVGLSAAMLVQVLSLWLHETCRVFEDRLTCQEDHQWFR